MQNSFMTLRNILCLHCLTPPHHPNTYTPTIHTFTTLKLLTTTNLFLISVWFVFFQNILWIDQYVIFSGWLIPVSNIHLWFTHILHGWRAHFFLLMNNIPLGGWATKQLHKWIKKCFLPLKNKLKKKVKNHPASLKPK